MFCKTNLVTVNPYSPFNCHYQVRRQYISSGIHTHNPLSHLKATQLLNYTAVYKFINSGMATRYAQPIIERVAEKPQLSGLKPIVEAVLKKTVFKVFLNGTLEEVLMDARGRLSRGEDVVLDYSACESKVGGEGYSRVLRITKELISEAGQLRKEFPNQNVGVALKLSTIAEPDFLKRLSMNLDGRSRFKKPLCDADKIKRNKLRLDCADVFSHAEKHNIKCYLDAEWKAINPIIEQQFLIALIRRQPVIGTLQAYLKDSQDTFEKWEKIVSELNRKKSKNAQPYHLEFKLVRGAYCNYKGEAQYIWNSVEETHSNYNRLMNKIAESSVTKNLYFATHNEESCLLAHQIQQNYPNKAVVWATLAGMANYRVDCIDSSAVIMPRKTKYTVYVQHDARDDFFKNLAYLFRRWTENEANNSREFVAVKQELKKRWFSFNL